MFPSNHPHPRVVVVNDSRPGTTVTPAPEPPRYPLASVDRALTVLELLRSSPAMRLSDVATELGVANSTAHRLLAALAHRGFVEQQADTRLYQAGPTLLDIGRNTVLLADLARRAHPLLVKLARELGETINLAVRQRTQVRYLDSVESTRSVRVAGRAGRTLPAHWTSSGKLLLADLGDDTVTRLFAGERFEPATGRTIDSLPRLLAELAATRQRGYATSQGESEDDVVSVAVALAGDGSRPLATVGCAAPAHRLDERQFGDVARIMQEAVRAAFPGGSPPPRR